MGDTLVDSEACRLITRVTQIIRNEYILKQKLANHAIIKRLDFLKQQEVNQQKDLRALLDSKWEIDLCRWDFSAVYLDFEMQLVLFGDYFLDGFVSLLRSFMALVSTYPRVV